MNEGYRIIGGGCCPDCNNPRNNPCDFMRDMPFTCEKGMGICKKEAKCAVKHKDDKLPSQLLMCEECAEWYSKDKDYTVYDIKFIKRNSKEKSK